MMRHRRKHDGHGSSVVGMVADVGDAQSDSDADSLPNNSEFLSSYHFFATVLYTARCVLIYELGWLY